MSMSSSFIVFTVIFNPLIHFELIFAFDMRKSPTSYGYTVIPALFVGKNILFTLNCFNTLVEIQLTVRVYFWTLNSVLLICVYFFLPELWYFDYYSFVL